MPATLGFQDHEEAPPHFIDNEDPKRSFSISDASVAFIREQVAAGRPFYVQASYTNYPLTGSKQSLLEGGIRVPFLVRGPGIQAGSISRQPVSGYDLLPTFFDLAGGRVALPDYVDGGSIRPLFSGWDHATVKRPHDGLFFHRPRTRVSTVRQGDYKLIIKWSSQGTVVSRELYHVAEDPREEDGRNIAAENPEDADRLQTTLLDYLQEIGAYSPPTR